MLIQCPSEDFNTGLMCSPVISLRLEYAQILSRVCCVDLGVCVCASPGSGHDIPSAKAAGTRGCGGGDTCMCIVFTQLPQFHKDKQRFFFFKLALWDVLAEKTIATWNSTINSQI